MAVGYGYNLTFIQLGLPDLGTELGLAQDQVAVAMAALASVEAVLVRERQQDPAATHFHPFG